MWYVKHHHHPPHQKDMKIDSYNNPVKMENKVSFSKEGWVKNYIKIYTSVSVNHLLNVITCCLSLIHL